VRRGSLYLGGARLRKDLTRFRKAPQVSAALSSAAPLRVPSRAQRLPPPRRFVLVLVVVLVLERVGDVSETSNVVVESRALGPARRAHRHRKRNNPNPFWPPRSASGLSGASPHQSHHPKPLLSGASPYRHPAVSTTLRVRCSSGHGQKRNTSTQALLTPGCSTDKRAN
jgi:hypothetical protein